MSKIISTGSTFRIYGDDLVTHNQLPAQIYSIRCSQMFTDDRILFRETC